MKGAGNTLNRLNYEPKEALALLVLKEDLTNFIDFILVVVVAHRRSLSYKCTIIGRQPTAHTHKNWTLLAPQEHQWQG